jgi:hypothetical protein
MVGANTTSRCRVEVALRHIELMDAGWLHKMRRTPVMRISILAVLTASLTAVGAQAADAPDEIRLGTVYTGSIASGLSVGGGGGSHAPQPEGARGSARAPSSLSIRAIGSIPSQLQQWCQPRGWNGISGCPALAGSGVSTSRLMTTGSCPLLTTTASQISFGLPLIS